MTITAVVLKVIMFTYAVRWHMIFVSGSERHAMKIVLRCVRVKNHVPRCLNWRRWELKNLENWKITFKNFIDLVKVLLQKIGYRMSCKTTSSKWTNNYIFFLFFVIIFQRDTVNFRGNQPYSLVIPGIWAHVYCRGNKNRSSSPCWYCEKQSSLQDDYRWLFRRNYFVRQITTVEATETHHFAETETEELKISVEETIINKTTLTSTNNQIENTIIIIITQIKHRVAF